ncbi:MULTISPECIES: N-acetylmuramic acid 6-phosphate etherase [Mesonia]|uniref:N-acetylmuramic acid 6-phosphate etherase n=1 Tax=Mesonia oceanica TaxID=2687242 RepID=A0AC61YCU0_9FLAO|nr:MULTISPECIES: N-acetylmuramic acid 6-phosphate etherase [Mesonia]MAN29256.1 N-acetylmuramic acid 6-phosphate etherase [Mesonia sp.]MAQ39920.1 N-acetylmuramic acid 6-phosphate etherase [Mesonia sp.]MBJ99054.1 N-acetylmuramic acid 6-phosphate etherase [Flavobacteriaceae bacterium]VVV02035.1 N-acetylmuramic acid 6-phosphate etherase [Mesonia oceanica]|tara:strand:+ start:35092 stop:35928 length:837 start_codon:yes stop_codon:yes gene_type:complete
MSKEFIKTTEQASNYDHLEAMSIAEVVEHINTEDKKVALAVEKVLPKIEDLISKIVEQLQNGGRLFYIGAGTSGRLGILDASECPPTFGVSAELVQGIIAGGDTAIRNAVENAEDNLLQGWEDLKSHQISSKDVVVGIAASGTTPYVIQALEKCNEHQIPTGCITCNKNSPLANTAQFPIEVIVGPEFVTGSSRMKAGTAQKMVLNMISTTTMIQLGRIKGNRMVDMQLSNQKLIERGTKMIQEATGENQEISKEALLKFGNVRKAIQYLQENDKENK